MIQWKMKELTETSWILTKDGTMHGLIAATSDGLKIIGPLDKKLFESANDLSQYLGGDLTFEQRDSEDDTGDEIGQIDGYPIKLREAHDIDKTNIISYSKTAKGKARFAAGYFSIEFDHGWTGSYCPRLQTLTNNTYIGPFSSKLEMLNAMAQKKRSSKL